MERDMRKDFEKWDKGEFVFAPVEDALMAVKGGEKIGSLLCNCTICPVGNATCLDAIDVAMAGFHPEKGTLKKTLKLCPLGVHDIDHCPLSK